VTMAGCPTESPGSGRGVAESRQSARGDAISEKDGIASRTGESCEVDRGDAGDDGASRAGESCKVS
jgi:hypothetical protein